MFVNSANPLLLLVAGCNPLFQGCLTCPFLSRQQGFSCLSPQRGPTGISAAELLNAGRHIIFCSHCTSAVPQTPTCEPGWSCPFSTQNHSFCRLCSSISDLTKRPQNRLYNCVGRAWMRMRFFHRWNQITETWRLVACMLRTATLQARKYFVLVVSPSKCQSQNAA